MTRRRSEAARVQDALRLRAALLGVFAGTEPTEADLSTQQHAAANAWSIVLACECCVLPLAARVRGAELLRALPPAVQTLITQREAAELQRVLAARQLLEESDQVSAGLGIPFVVLKGGALPARCGRAG